MAPPPQGQPVRDQPHQDGTLATNDSGPPRGPTVGVARAAAQAALGASSTDPPSWNLWLLFCMQSSMLYWRRGLELLALFVRQPQ